MIELSQKLDSAFEEVSLMKEDRAKQDDIVSVNASICCCSVPHCLRLFSFLCNVLLVFTLLFTCIRGAVA